MAEKRYRIDESGASHAIDQPTGLVYAINVNDEVEKIDIINNVVSVQGGTSAYPLYIIETKDENTVFSQSTSGHLQVKYEDPSYYWEFPEGTTQQLAFADSAKDVYVCTSATIPNYFAEVRVRPGKSMTSIGYLGKSIRNVQAHGVQLYVYLGSGSIPSEMKKVNYTDGFTPDVPTAVTEPTYTLAEVDGKITVVVNEIYSVVGNPDVYVLPDAWVRITKDGTVALSENMTSNNVVIREDSTHFYAKLWADDSSLSISKGNNQVKLESNGVGHEYEKSVRRLTRINSNTYQLEYLQSISQTQYRQITRNLSTTYSEGNAVPRGEIDTLLNRTGLTTQNLSGSLGVVVDGVGVTLYYSDVPVISVLGETAETTDTNPEADSISVMFDGSSVSQVGTLAGDYVVTYTFTDIGVTLTRTISVATTTTASDTARDTFNDLAAEDSASVSAAMNNPPASMSSLVQKIDFRKHMLQNAAASSSITIGRSTIFANHASVPQALLDKTDLRVRATGRIEGSAKSDLKAKAGAIVEDFTSSAFPTDLYWPMADVDDCFAVRLAHSDGTNHENVIFRVKAKDNNSVTYAMQKGDEDEIEYASQAIDAIQRVTVQVGLKRYFFFLGGAQSDGEQVMEDRSRWHSMTVTAQTIETAWSNATINLTFDIGATTVYHTEMELDTQETFQLKPFVEPWTAMPSDVIVSGTVDLAAAESSLIYTRGALVKTRNVVIPYTVQDMKKIHSVDDVGETDNTVDFTVSANRKIRVSCPTLKLTATDSGGIIVKPSTATSGATSVTLNPPLAVGI